MLVRNYLKTQYKKPGNVFLGVVHRLDKPVSGVLLFARTSKAAARLCEQFRQGTVEKTYWAVVEGEVASLVGSLEDWLCKDKERGRVDVVSPDTEGARQALLHFERKAVFGGLSLLELGPETGRTHQLRVRLANHGHPIFGDAKYGSTSVFERSIALHARSLTFLHPIRYEPVTCRQSYLPCGRGDFSSCFTEAVHERNPCAAPFRLQHHSRRHRLAWPGLRSARRI